MPSFYFPAAGENFSLHCISKQEMGQQKRDRAENQYQRCEDRSWRSSLSLKPKYTVDGAEIHTVYADEPMQARHGASPALLECLTHIHSLSS